MVEGFCIKDKKKVTMKNPKPVILKKKIKAVMGTCPKCGNKVYAFRKA